MMLKSGKLAFSRGGEMPMVNKEDRRLLHCGRLMWA